MNKIGYILISLLVLWLCFLYGRRSAEPSVQKVEITKTDTLMTEVVKIVIDTQYIDRPVPYEVEVRDTIYLQNPQYPQYPQPEVLVHQTKLYKDSTYSAQISGYEAQLDWIETNNRTIVKKIVVKEQIQVKPPKWSLYAFSEAEISNVPGCKFGLGASCSKNRWTISADAGKDLLRNDNFVRINGKFAFVRF